MRLALLLVAFLVAATLPSPASPALYAHHWTGGRAATATPPPRVESPRQIERQERRAGRLAERIAPRVAAVASRFQTGVERLEREAGPGRSLDAAGVDALVATTRRELDDILSRPALRPVFAYFARLVERWPEPVAGRPGDSIAARGPRSAAAAERGYGLAAWPPPPPPPQPPVGTPDDRSSRGFLAAIGDYLQTLVTRSDSRLLTQPICVRSVPNAGALVALSAAVEGARVIEQTTEGRLAVVYRGLYAYRARLGDRLVACPTASEPDDCAFVDLWLDDRPFLVCDFRDGVERCLLADGDVAACGP
jgi:hypothetical protein